MKKVILVWALIFTSVAVCQSNGVVSGKITDKESFGEPLLYANVELKGTKLKTQTNLHGNFEIKDVPAGRYTLIISYLGYETNKIPVEVKKNQKVEVSAGLSSITLDIDLPILTSENSKETPKVLGLPEEEKD